MFCASDWIRTLKITMEDFNRGVVSRLPMAESVLQLFSYLNEKSFLSSVFERHRGRSYEDVLTFGTITGLISDALLEHEGSGHRAMKQAQVNHELDTSVEACYAKLRRIPQSLSHGYLFEGTQRLNGVMMMTRSSLPISLRKFAVHAIDGKKIKHAAKRMLPTRKFRGSLLGGKVLVALDLRTGLAVAMNSHEDGETNDCPLVPGLMTQLRNLPMHKPLLSVCDRQFCDLKTPALLAENGGHFLIRYHPKVTYTRDPHHPVSTGTDATGRRYTDERGWLGKETDKRRLYVRRIHLTRPGEDPLIVITDLLDEQTYPTVDLLELYRMRWGIERVFQRITEVFHLRQLISSTPKGTIFQCAFCLLLYNLIEVECSYVAKAQHLEPEQISMENVFYSAHRQLIGWTEMLSTSWTVNHFQHPLTQQSLIQRLHELLDCQWKEEWMKSKKSSYKPKTKDPPTAGGHTSIYRLIRCKKAG
jgi:hypothetical protein